jgi:hypothetical protein
MLLRVLDSYFIIPSLVFECISLYNIRQKYILLCIDYVESIKIPSTIENFFRFIYF